MNILITGGAGYIGSHVAKQLLEGTNHDIVIVDNLSKGSIKAIESLQKIRNFDFVKTSLENINDMEELFKSKNFDAVIHFAAFIEVFESMKNPLKYYLNNTANALNLITLCDKYNVNKFIFSSTAATYGEPENGVVSESTPQNPINPYGKSKVMVEWILKDLAVANKDFKFVILRYFNVAGASLDQSIGQNYPNATHLVKVAVQTILGKRESMSIFGTDYPTEDGTCVRDYIHIEDLASAHLSALRYLGEGKDSNIFNVGYGNGYSVKEVVEKAKSVSGVDFKVNEAPRRDGDPAKLIANSQRLRSTTDWSPKNDDLALIIKTALDWEKNI